MQYIKKIKNLENYKNIKKGFEWNSIPEFAVITGENGSGKSSLLQGIEKRKFIIDGNETSQVIIGLYNDFKLQGNGYDSRFIEDLSHYERNLMEHYLRETNLNDHPNSTFIRVKKIVAEWGKNFSKEIERLTFRQFIERDFSSFSEGVRNTLNSHRDGLNLVSYYQHFKRNGMSEEKFYLSSQEEIEQWFSQLQDKNFESRKTIFDERALNTIFGDYLIRKINKRDELDRLDENLSNTEIRKRIEEEIGKNPLDEINRLLEQAYSKYTLVSELRKDSGQPRVICKTKDGTNVSLQDLSTGEQIIISLYMWQYDKNPLHSMVLLLDEPDAHLNPKMAKNLIDILKNVIVKTFDCQVIMTTHSLSTVAQCEDGDLFFMEDGDIWESSREEAIEMLAQGISLDSFWENIETLLNSPKILFVEGKTDKKHIEKYFSITSLKHPFKIIDCKSADKMPFYANMIKTLKGTIAEKCLFLLDNDNKGRAKKNEIEALGFKTMFVSQGQQYGGEDFTIENCYNPSIVKAYNPKATTSWNNNHKNRFAQKSFSLNEMQGIGILIDEIKKELKIP